jgi:branched-chain amino acid transport system permease protein
MNVDLFVSQLLNGISAGVIYASLALAIVLIFRTTGILNFAQGEMALFSTYFTWWLTTRGLAIGLAIVIAVAASFVGGALVERVVIRPFESAPPLVIVIATLGLFLAFNSLTQVIFGTDAKQMPSVFPATVWDVGGVRIEAETVGLIVVLGVECLLLWLLFQRTRAGLALRAVASEPDSSRLLGIKVGSMLMLGWGLAAALGAVAGAMVVPTTPALTASSLQAVLVFSFAAAALGGFDSPLGAVVGGLIVGIAHALTIQYLDPLNDIELLVPFGIILGVLLVKPSGLFGTARVERV